MKTCFTIQYFQFRVRIFLLEYRHVQVWIIAKSWKQSPVGWLLKILQET